MTKQERLDVYKQMKNVLSNSRITGFCGALTQIYYSYNINDFQELMEYKPKGVHKYTYWFTPNDNSQLGYTVVNNPLKYRLNILDKIIDKLQLEIDA